ncbi:SigE family RNA polymerase sigma factor [Saccharothrix longispora]|uniref:SigE family RNA polymerase sigma factor n=1 Tax=Saccharothrix longispora TaxID=33920 RepID=UPI0028FD461E|nr:SigE family RNA polymerase sigma factor [Saccharothrix longispora]MBY8851103.1 SigE family RNA polymerase sigma factor [Saccharothrix sp. MB29]MDU0290035.1 SigE family RNA polymerase sigma factor [Saccharothrix longispora]
MSDRDTAFAEYFAARSDALRGTAYLLCGDWHRAEDLVQTTFTKLYVAWRRITRHDALDAYARQILVRTFVSELRRGWFRKERVSEAPADVPAASSGSAEDRLVLLAALAGVPPRQRAVLVLRYWEDLSVEQTAGVLGCSEGTVKSQAARGLQTLRGLVNPEQGAKVR